MGNFNLENYVPVSERIQQFWAMYATGRITTEILQHDSDAGLIVFKASAYRNPDDAEPAATGHAFEARGEGYVNKTSYIENCETSAVGRALANLGFEITSGVASREDMQKAERMQTNEATRKVYTPFKPETGKAQRVTAIATDAQLNLLRNKAKLLNLDADKLAHEEFPDVGSVAELSKQATSWLIDSLTNKAKAKAA